MDKKEKKPKIPSDWKRARAEVIDHFVQACYKPVNEGGYRVTIIQWRPDTAVSAETPFGQYCGFAHCLMQDEYDAKYGMLLAFRRAGSRYWRDLVGDREDWDREIERIGVDEWLNRVKGAS